MPYGRSLSVGLIVLWPALGRATETAQGIHLNWVRGEGAEKCATLEQLKRDVRARLGRDPFLEPAGHRIEGFVSREPSGWVARLYENDPEGRRIGARKLESTASDCRELDAAVALAVALIIDPTASEAGAASAVSRPASSRPTEPLDLDAPPPAPAEASSEPPGPRPEDAPLSRASSRSARAEPPCSPLEPPSRTVLLVGSAVTYDLLPGVAPAFSLTADHPLAGPAHLRVGALYAPERRTRGKPGAEGDFGFGLTALTAGVCYEPRASLAASACLGAQAGGIHAVVYRPDPDVPGERFWGAFRGDAGLLADLDPLVAELRAFLLVPWIRWRFLVDATPAFQLPPVVPGAELSLGVRFP